ncbi:hypothetical protein RYA05_03090 [Pseudomonas syringae pv. actinidiae]|nr:hypothetical protein [Pseudomonas syringae pv. actinidiae]
MRLKASALALAMGLPAAYIMNKAVIGSFTAMTNLKIDHTLSELTAITWAVACCLLAYGYLQGQNHKTLRADHEFKN